MEANEIKALYNDYVLHTYARAPLVFDRADGVRVYDTEGRAYLDFVGGIAVNALGHCDADVVRAIKRQASRLMHVSNLYYTEPQAQVARMLVESSFADKVFFCNSGAESVEAAIKFSRKWGKQVGGDKKTEFLAFSSAFHGRTMGALALTPRPHYQDAFRPLMPDVRIAPFNDLSSVENVMTDRTCGCFVEPIQGEGGVIPAHQEFLDGLRSLCDRHNALLIFDEIQCGLGRTGHLWAHQFYNVYPDLMTLAKPIGGGLPMGAVLLRQKVADVMAPGDHASTFAANPVVCAAANVVLSKISDPAFLEHVRDMGGYLGQRLEALASSYKAITQVRGRGLMWGMQTNQPVAPVVSAGFDAGLLTCTAGPNVLRLLPPLTVTQADIDEAIAILEETFGTLEA